MTPNTAWSPYPVGRMPALSLGERAFHAAIVGYKPSLGDYTKLKGARLIPHEPSPNIQVTAYREWRRGSPKKPRPDVGAERRFMHSWFCVPAQTDLGANFWDKHPYYRSKPRTMGAYCGAPDGVRCGCGAQLAGHDPGDEDRKAP